MRTSSLPLLALLLCLATACPPPVGDGDTGDDDATATPSPARAIPDPGGEQDDWGFTINSDNDVCCAIPEEAYPVGTVNFDPGYIQGAFDSGMAFFYVFRSAPGLQSFTFPLFFEEVHLHDGAGLVFGDLITPSATADFEVSWDIEGDHVYVVEVRSSFEGFF